MLVAILLLPLWLMIIGSFQDINGVMKMPPDLLPKDPTLKNYTAILGSADIRWFFNSAFIVILSIVLSVGISCSAGYAMAHFDFKFKKLIWILLLSQIMIPIITLYIPRYVVIKHLGISGTIWGAVFPCVLSPMGIYLAKIYFETIPDSIMESARLDGASEIRILRSIVVPISKPIITALALFGGVGSLSNYIWQMLVLQKTARQPLLVGLMKAVNNFSDPIMRLNPLGRCMAVGSFLLFPIIIIFAFTSRYFTEGISGAIKE